MTHPRNDPRVLTRSTTITLHSFAFITPPVAFLLIQMSLSKEVRTQTAVDAYLFRQYRSIREAAAAQDIDRKTLRRRIEGGLSRAIAREPQQLLSNEQEHQLKRWILDLEIVGVTG